MSIRYFILFIVLAVTGFASCKNNDNVFPVKQSSFVNVVNAGVDTLNIYLNGTRQNNTSSLYPFGQLNYISVPAGSDNLQLKKANTIPVLFTYPLSLKDSIYYSVFVVGESADKTFTTVDSLLVDSGIASVKFVNASPDAGALTVTINDTLYARSAVYKSTSKVLNVPMAAGAITVNKVVKVYLPGASIPKLDTTVTFNQNTVYTLFTKGTLAGKGSAAFDVGLLLNGVRTL